MKFIPSLKPASWAILAAVLGLAAVLLFSRLGHYALWDDEAATALHGLGVWRTGDTTAVLDHNIIATYQGANLRNLHERLESPLQSYVAAPFVGLLRSTALVARLPFTIAGCMCVGFLLLWISHRYSEPWRLGLFGLALVCNVSFFLYARQSRYYILAILLSMLLAWIYLHWQGGRRALWVFSLLSAALFTANLLCFAAFNGCLLVDYLVWGRKSRRLQLADWAVIALPQLGIIGFVLAIWNPLGMDPRHSAPLSKLGSRLVLFWWNLRDLSRCEFGIGALLVAAPLAGWMKRNPLLLRASLAALVYVVVISIFSPQPVELTTAADVRYLAALIPLLIFLGVECLVTLFPRQPAVALLVGAIAFGTNLLTGGLPRDGFRSTIALYAGELWSPSLEPYSVASDWVRHNVSAGQSLWVLPDYMTYPLMFHAPAPVYAWQLENPPKPQFAGLPPIHFQGLIPPDYILAFGPLVGEVRQLMEHWAAQGVRYEQVATLDCFWKDMYRPEIMFRTFRTISDYDRETEAIYAFRRVAPPLGSLKQP